MATEGRCNCGSITVKLPESPEGSLLCYCLNCQRASAGLGSVNYYLDTALVEVKDSKGTLKEYKDSDTKSGNTITRKFCGNCGSPVMTLITPDAPKCILKAGLFDRVSEPMMEVFKETKAPWVKITSVDKE